MHSREQHLARVREEYRNASKNGKTPLLNEANPRRRLMFWAASHGTPDRPFRRRLEPEAQSDRRVASLNLRARDTAESAVRVRPARGAISVDRPAIDIQRGVRIAWIEVIQDIVGFELEAQNLGMVFRTDVDVFLNAHIEVLDARSISQRRRRVADAEGVHRGKREAGRIEGIPQTRIAGRAHRRRSRAASQE